MTKRIKKGYDWAEEQQEKWENVATDKIEQLNKLSQTHIDWFNKHSTISDILAWKRPLLDLKNKDLPKGETIASNLQHQSIPTPTIEDSIHLVVANPRQESNDGKDQVLITNDNLLEPSETHASNNSSSLNQHKVASDQIGTQQNDNLTDELIISSDVNNFTKDRAVDSSSLDNIKANIPTSEKTITRASMTEQDNCTTKSVELSVLNTTTTLKTAIKRRSSVSRTSEEETPVCTPELVTDSDCTQTQTQKDPQTPESYVQVEMGVIDDDFRLDTVQSEHSTKETFGNTEAKPSLLDYDDEYENEEDDEIQLVVSNRNFEDEYKKSEQNILKSPVRAAIARSVMSPPRNTAQSNPNKISPIRHQSPFMSRLFQFGSTVTNDKSLKKDISFITTRPKSTVSTSTINSEASNNLSMNLLKNPDNKRPLEAVASEIEVSEIEVSEIEVSDTLPHSRFKRPKPFSKKPAIVDLSLSDNMQKSENDKPEAAEMNEKEDKQADPKYIVPSWATNPELSLSLKNQSGLDPDKIFGRISPLCLEEIFSHSHKYLEIPEQPPQ